GSDFHRCGCAALRLCVRWFLLVGGCDLSLVRLLPLYCWLSIVKLFYTPRYLAGCFLFNGRIICVVKWRIFDRIELTHLPRFFNPETESSPWNRRTIPPPHPGERTQNWSLL